MTSQPSLEFEKDSVKFFYHTTCFKCTKCSSKLSSDTPFYFHESSLFCTECYLDQVVGKCHVCQKTLDEDGVLKDSSGRQYHQKVAMGGMRGVWNVIFKLSPLKNNPPSISVSVALNAMNNYKLNTLKAMANSFARRARKSNSFPLVLAVWKRLDQSKRTLNIPFPNSHLFAYLPYLAKMERLYRWASRIRSTMRIVSAAHSAVKSYNPNTLRLRISCFVKLVKKQSFCPRVLVVRIRYGQMRSKK